MATYQSVQVSQEYPLLDPGPNGMAVSYGTYGLTVAPVAMDVIQLCRVPPGHVIIGGWVMAKDVDTGTGVFGFNFGFDTDPDVLGVFAVASGDAILGYKPQVGIAFPVTGDLMIVGPVSTGLISAGPRIVQVTVTTAPNVFNVATPVPITAMIYYTKLMTVGDSTNL